MSDTKPLGLAMIGLQHQHPRWYKPLWPQLPQYKPLAVCDPDEAILRSENEVFGLDAYTDYHRVLERDDIDVVIIWLPHSRMPRAVENAAAAGKHVIVEKPCCANLDGARQLVETARRYPRIKISSPYCWRTHPATEYVRDAIDRGLIGEVVAVEARLNAGGAWRYVRDHAEWMLRADEGGGPMWNLGVHWIDYIRWVLGREVTQVSGMVSGPLGEPKREIEDNAQALLKFDNGAIAMLDISYALKESYPGVRDIYLAIRGSTGTIQWAPAWESLVDEVLIVSESDKAAGQPVRRVRVERPDVPGYGGVMALNWLRDFAHAIRHDEPPLIDMPTVYAGILVADAFYRSVKSGRAESIRQ